MGRVRRAWRCCGRSSIRGRSCWAGPTSPRGKPSISRCGHANSRLASTCPLKKCPPQKRRFCSLSRDWAAWCSQVIACSPLCVVLKLLHAPLLCDVGVGPAVPVRGRQGEGKGALRGGTHHLQGPAGETLAKLCGRGSSPSGRDGLLLLSLSLSLSLLLSSTHARIARHVRDGGRLTRVSSM